jgi:CBS domain containing-hemolysin-like protein
MTFSRIPVYGKDPEDVVGIVRRTVVLTAIASDQWEVTLETLMEPVHFVIRTTSAGRLLRMFLERRQHMFAVINEYGGISGVVTLEDVIEEILGQEIVDESDQVVDMRELARQRRKQILEQYGH